MIKNIMLNDGIEVEVELDESKAYEIADGDIVDSSIEKIQTFLTKIMQPISNTYKELDKDMSLESAKVTLGVKIGLEGNFILAKSNTEANIQIEMTLKSVSRE